MAAVERRSAIHETEPNAMPFRTRRILVRAIGLALAVFPASVPGQAQAQYVLVSPAGDSLTFEPAELRAHLETARVLYADLQEDPRVLYLTPPVRQRVNEQQPAPAYPWNVVTVLSDSVADLQGLPANLREADRAYYNYAVLRMRVVRSADPDVECDSVLALEERVVSSFADGWIVSRTLFGGPEFRPLDEIVFARQAGHLRALLAALNDRQVGACAGQWADAHPDRVAAYQAWRRESFPALELEGPEAAIDSTSGERPRPPLPPLPIDGGSDLPPGPRPGPGEDQ